MNESDTSSRRPAGNRKPIRPWDVAGSGEEEDKLVEFPAAARRAEEGLAPALDDDLDGKVEQQLRHLRLAKGEVEGTIRRHTEELQQLDGRRAQLAADLSEMHTALANLASQIRELEVLGELIRVLERNR